MADEQNPNPQTGSIFALIAYILFHMRHALEDIEEVGRPPRWVRIARAAPEKKDFLGSIVSQATNGIAETVSLLAHLTLELERKLTQADAAAAIIGVVAQMIHAVTHPEFQKGVEAMIGDKNSESIAKAAEQIKKVSDGATEIAKYIPGPEDIEGLGHELYRLLCIVQKPLPRKDSADQVNVDDPELRGFDHVSQNEIGKIRLVAWAYEHGIDTHGIGATPVAKELFKLGSRRLFQALSNSGLAAQSKMTWGSGSSGVPIFQFTYGGNGNDDLKELVELLRLHGYTDPAMPDQPNTLTQPIRMNLMRFQAINDLPITGDLDNHTLNRLLHIDFGRKNLRRAKPYVANYPWPWENEPVQFSGTLPVVNAGGDQPAHVGIAPIENKPLRYYLVPTAPEDASRWSHGAGWIRDAGGAIGFVAAQSRTRSAYNKDGGNRHPGREWSEGESAHGEFFYAARLSEPWVDGRTGNPNSDSLAPTPPPVGTISRMYQWIRLPSWLLTPPGPGLTLFVYASALQRSLFTNRGQSGFPDRGRILIESYESDGFGQGTITLRDEAKRKQVQGSGWFPDRTITTAGLQLNQIDRNRLWILRKTEPMQVPNNSAALCLVAEGEHQAGLDTDAYFDDFQVHYYWERNAS